ncbi:hypothetical protein KJR22_02665 [Streptococcus infantarius subsp. infantarius]|uniref:Uncharacterized protein n=1 Tax=Siphoviridae sp. ctC6Q17 TaxID=2827271 RepID=A0A8S5R3J3_9CAUD|nr:hypothetical protein [Streptococcus infantarius]DAE25714.1 MAG TPA: hypothetical protein [Siphoviridae sp. ctC6Q17]MBT0896052.1 hypothetical protein [Streptococcus infantarius subsp. infantarius]MBT0899902.1 hypothetical protein [Streptococcus infantarius subsp. infantarius]MBT1033541.1 hypothetical protein [Streptococcus infantarius subsp. infantarius]MCO4628672.1 hypothetical protein [Streptococcus infantarius subsp. infantarius]
MIFVKQYFDGISYNATDWLNHEIELNKHCWSHKIVGYQLGMEDVATILVEWVGLTGNEFEEWEREDFSY